MFVMFLGFGMVNDWIWVLLVTMRNVSCVNSGSRDWVWFSSF